MTERNTRRVPQMVPREQIKRERRKIEERLMREKGMRIAQTHGVVGFMVNRAPWPMVRAAIELSLNDPDPLAAAMERLARECAHG